MPKIFISYRRDDAAYVAVIIRDRLASEFGTDSVFMDVDNIPLGVDFREHLGKAVAESDVLLAVIGDNWLGLTQDSKTRRLDDPKDFVRVEVEAALERGIPVVPILVGRAAVPSIDVLPDALKPLAYRMASEVRAGAHLKSHLDLLCRGLARFPTSPPLPQSTLTAAARKRQDELRGEAALRQAEALRQEAARKAEEAHKQEVARKAENTRKQDVAPKAEESRKQAVARQHEELRKQDDARQRIEDETRKLDIADRDDAMAWRSACNVHSYESYERYAQEFPNGKYRSISIARYRELKPFWKKDQFS